MMKSFIICSSTFLKAKLHSARYSNNVSQAKKEKYFRNYLKVYSIAITFSRNIPWELKANYCFHNIHVGKSIKKAHSFNLIEIYLFALN